MNPIVTTTDSIENARITDYIDILRCSLVVGTDIALTDILGGADIRYRNRLNSIYDKCLREIKMKGRALRADAIVGLHTDFEEILGKGKTKFVVSMVGTAVHLDNVPQGQNGKEESIVKLSEFKRRQLVENLCSKLEDEDYCVGEEDWNNIIEYSISEVAPQLYKRYLLLSRETISNTPLAEKRLFLYNFIPFLQSLDFEEAATVVYGDVTTAPICTRDIIYSCLLFHPQKIASLLEPQNKHLVISLLDSDKPFYSAEDLSYMKQIMEYLETLPDTGHYEKGRGKLFGKYGTVLVCERGHTTAVEEGGHCTETLDHDIGICNLNIKGLTEKEVEAISSFRSKVSTLEKILAEKWPPNF